MRWFSTFFCKRRWVLTGCLAATGGIVLFIALQRLPARDLGKAGEEPTSTAAATDRGGKANLGYVGGRLSPEKPGQWIPYETTGVEVVKHCKTLHVTGSLVADQLSNVASNVNGIVTEIRVDRGSVVKKGDVMVQLDPTNAQNHLDEGIALVEELKTKLSLSDDPAAPFVVEDQPEVKLAKASWDLAVSRRKRADNLLPQKAISLDDCEQIAEAEFADSAIRKRSCRYARRINRIRRTS